MSTYQLVVVYEDETDEAATSVAEQALAAFKDKPDAKYAFNRLDAESEAQDVADSE